MSWTHERTDFLKTLWADGVSASAIAAVLGGTTRNAVIGKVQRLGLARHSTARRSRSNPTVSTPRSRANPPPAHKQAKRSRSKPFRHAVPPMRRSPPTSHALPELEPAPVIPITVASLTDALCAWPLGDPKRPDFHFCGRLKPVTGPYCAHHAALASKPAR